MAGDHVWHVTCYMPLRRAAPRKAAGALQMVTEAETQTSAGSKEVSPSGTTPWTVSEERTAYLISRQREVRCRLWFQVTPFREGLFKYFLVGIEELG